jgi:hypothetical protein
MELLLLGIGLGAVGAFFVFRKFSGIQKRGKTNTQAVLLLEKIRSVCKFITVEGDFSEIYHYENVQKKWLNLFKGKKQALILIEAKAHVGFDLTQIKMEANELTRRITISAFPEPNLLSIDTDFKYYDKKEGWANAFTAADLTEVNNEAKKHIIDKIPSSGLYLEAAKQAIETLHLVEQLAGTIKWNVDYSALKLPEKKSNNLLLENEI